MGLPPRGITTRKLTANAKGKPLAGVNFGDTIQVPFSWVGSSMVEQRPFKALVVGSSPTQPTSPLGWRGFISFVGLAVGIILGSRKISIGVLPNINVAKSILPGALASP